MIYQIELIKTTLEGSSIATAAGKGTMSGSVFIKIGEQDMVGCINIGRLPAIYIRETSVNYEFQAEPSHQGTRTAEFMIRILVPTSLNRSSTQYELLEKIKIAALTALTANANLGVTNVRENSPEVTAMATHMDLTVSTESSYCNTYKEQT